MDSEAYTDSDADLHSSPTLPPPPRRITAARALRYQAPRARRVEENFRWLWNDSLIDCLVSFTLKISPNSICHAKVADIDQKSILLVGVVFETARRLADSCEYDIEDLETLRVRKRAKKIDRFATLPSELRNKIYEWVALGETELRVNHRAVSGREAAERPKIEGYLSSASGLCAVSREIRKNYLSIFAGQAPGSEAHEDIKVHIVDFDFKTAEEYLNCISDGNIDRISYHGTVTLYMSFSTAFARNPNTKGLQKWLHYRLWQYAVDRMIPVEYKVRQIGMAVNWLHPDESSDDMRRVSDHFCYATLERTPELKKFIDAFNAYFWRVSWAWWEDQMARRAERERIALGQARGDDVEMDEVMDDGYDEGGGDGDGDEIIGDGEESADEYEDDDEMEADTETEDDEAEEDDWSDGWSFEEE